MTHRSDFFKFASQIIYFHLFSPLSPKGKLTVLPFFHIYKKHFLIVKHFEFLGTYKQLDPSIILVKL